MEKPSIARNTGGGGSEPQGRQGLAPNGLMFEPQITLTGWLPKLLCHPELDSGSSPRNIRPLPENIHKIPFASRTAQRHVRGGLATCKAAFTLAEVLITLGIIGVVAAMTLPTLIQNYKRHETSARLKKFYSMMSQAIKLSEAQNGEIEYWERKDNIANEDPEAQGVQNYDEMVRYWNKYYAPYIKTLKITRSPSLNGKGIQGMTKIYLADGSTIDAWNGGCMSFQYDVNGDNRPNTFGIDIFSFHICEAHSQRHAYLQNTKNAFGPKGSKEAVTRDKAMELCVNNQNCTSLLMLYDNFEFKDDYPYKF